MSAPVNVEDILKQVAFLFEKYSLERRATTQPYLLSVAKDTVANYSYTPKDPLVRETLMEHVGSLPVLATALYPYINDEEVDLGKALTMLAIHDIGELITGDIMTFTKPSNAHHAEREAALQLLHPTYHALYIEAENKSSKTAKFAKTIDKITPDILDFLTPADVTVRRYQHFVGIQKHEIIDLIEKHKRPFMLWNPFLEKLHVYLLQQLATKLKNLP